MAAFNQWFLCSNQANIPGNYSELFKSSGSITWDYFSKAAQPRWTRNPKQREVKQEGLKSDPLDCSYGIKERNSHLGSPTPIAFAFLNESSHPDWPSSAVTTLTRIPRTTWAWKTGVLLRGLSLLLEDYYVLILNTQNLAKTIP